VNRTPPSERTTTIALIEVRRAELSSRSKKSSEAASWILAGAECVYQSS
jgi:hypothetical protein